MSDSPPASGLASPVRNRYFYGKLLDAAHLQLEQDYFNGKRQLLNRLVAGTGVVAGLDVVPMGDGRVAISPGVALDATGREIVVAAPTEPVDPRQPTDGAGRPAGDRLDGASVVTVGLVYAERATEPAPVYAGTDDGELASAPSLVEEGFAVVVVAEGPAGVPLARLHLPEGGAAVPPEEIDRSVRTTVGSDVGAAGGGAPGGGGAAGGGAAGGGSPDAGGAGPALAGQVAALAAAVERILSTPRLGYLGGDAQSQDVSSVLAEPVVVSVSDAEGAAVAGVAVTFTVRGGGGAVSADGADFARSVDVASAADGTASARWRLGPDPGIGSVAAGVPGGPPVTFVALGRQP